MAKLVLDKGIIYYTENRLENKIADACKEQLEFSALDIVSVSLKPILLGQNIVLNLKPGIVTMSKQIMAGLEAGTAKYVFFAEHDVLYHPTHFNFTPPRDDVFYYNTNVWRWDYPNNRAITYDKMRSLSGLCANRELLVEHYRNRLAIIKEKGYADTSREPSWARILGHEPGRVKNSLSEDRTQEWKSPYPNVDIRHGKTLTKRKVQLADFKHQPTNWQETKLSEIPGWDLIKMFNLCKCFK